MFNTTYELYTHRYFTGAKLVLCCIDRTRTEKFIYIPTLFPYLVTLEMDLLQPDWRLSVRLEQMVMVPDAPLDNQHIYIQTLIFQDQDPLMVTILYQHVYPPGLDYKVFTSSCLPKKFREDWTFGGITYKVSGIPDGKSLRSNLLFFFFPKFHNRKKVSMSIPGLRGDNDLLSSNYSVPKMFLIWVTHYTRLSKIEFKTLIWQHFSEGVIV